MAEEVILKLTEQLDAERQLKMELILQFAEVMSKVQLLYELSSDSPDADAIHLRRQLYEIRSQTFHILNTDRNFFEHE